MSKLKTAKADSKADQLLKLAQQKAAEVTYWHELHNAIYGVGAKYSELFPTEADRVAFGKTDQAKQIRDLIDQLREQNGDPPLIEEKFQSANGYLSVRIPKSLHVALLHEAESEGVSLNQLIGIKLAATLQAVIS